MMSFLLPVALTAVAYSSYSQALLVVPSSSSIPSSTSGVWWMFGALSLGCTRSWCCSILLPVKRVSSLLPEAKQSIPRWEAEVTVQHVTSHFISRCILLSRSYDLICHKHSDDLR